MTRPLRILSGAEPLDVLAQLRSALSGGPAILPRPAGPSPRALAGVQDENAPLAEVAVNVALVVETSGSTGRPKRVVLSPAALLASAAATQSALGGVGQWLLALPTHYIAGLQVLVRSIAAEIPPLVLPPGHFDAAAFVATARDFRPHTPRFTALVPTQLHRLVELAGRDAAARDTVRSFDGILVGGQATAPALLERARALGAHVVTTYGSSETSGGCVYDGFPIGTTRVAVVDGQVELAGPTLAEGYLTDPAATDAAFRMRDGLRWYRTGDAGAVSNGVLSVTGRLDSIIVSGGEKLSLDRVETVARALPELPDAVVVSAPDDEWGQRSVVFSTARPDAATRAALKDALLAALGRVAARTVLTHVDAIPTLSSGKPDRVALAASAARPGCRPSPGAAEQ